MKWLPLWAVGLFANFYFLLRFLSGDQLLWVRLTNYFLPWAGLMLASCFGLSVVFKNRKLSVVLFIPLFLVGVIYAPLFWNCKPTANAGGQKIKVMSYNIWSNNSRMKACAAVILKESPDILLLQEIRPEQMSALELELRSEGLNMAFDPGTEQAIISRYPIKGSEAWFWKNRSQKAVLEAPLGPVTVVNVHAYKHGWLERHRLMEALLVEDVIPEKGPLILGGGFQHERSIRNLPDDSAAPDQCPCRGRLRFRVHIPDSLEILELKTVGAFTPLPASRADPHRSYFLQQPFHDP